MKQSFYQLSMIMCLAGAAHSLPLKAFEANGRIGLRNADRTIKGTVKDDKGEILPGVSVILKGTTRGSSTDEKGSFQLSVPDQGAVLVFSFVGYVQQEFPLNNQSTFDIVLLPDTKSLEEFVVVGYGTQKKS